MLNILRARILQRHRTMAFPAGPPPDLPPRYRGRPAVHPELCPRDCAGCAKACPTAALRRQGASCELDAGRCLFCGACAEACPAHAIEFTAEYRQAVRQRDHLKVTPVPYPLAEPLDDTRLRLLSRSLRLRQVSAGGCNACEADTNVLGTIGWDMGRFGIQFVASPRHADGLLITGPVPDNMRLALEKTYAAVPNPKVVIAVGACAISGGPYADHPEVHNGAAAVVPVDLFIPGCPPHPLTILDGLLRVLDRLGEEG